MKLFVEGPDVKTLKRHIEQSDRADFVYMYPPRQAYRPIPWNDLIELRARSLERSSDVNLYLHFPFCKRLCAFCNLYTTVLNDALPLEAYANRLINEIRSYGDSLYGMNVRTLYLGGGTPSLAEPGVFERVFSVVEEAIGGKIADIPEVALEVDPETVTIEKFTAYRRSGINRVNLGVQSLVAGELHGIGRKRQPVEQLAALETVQKVGFTNVCVDLIYGLPGQDATSWRNSVETVIDRRPQTICTYALTLRPATGFDSCGYRSVDGASQYEKYGTARDLLLEAGYRQETPVRFTTLAEGGYRQKANHWALENLVGCGAGARSYLWECDLRNGYGARSRATVLQRYMRHAGEGSEACTEGFVMNDEERCRKAVILGLHHLNRCWYRDLFGVDPADRFDREFEGLFELGLLSERDGFFELTVPGVQYRDLIVQLFFSSRVRELVTDYRYDD